MTRRGAADALLTLAASVICLAALLIAAAAG